MLWPWPLTFDLEREIWRHVIKLYKIWAKSNNPRRELFMSYHIFEVDFKGEGLPSGQF